MLVYPQAIGATSPGRFSPSEAQALLLTERETYRDVARGLESGLLR